MRSQKTTFIVTVFNEEQTIEELLDSLFSQTQKPDEIVIVDGGSSDKTVLKIKNYKPKSKGIKIPLKVSVKKGNRSVGRNEAIKQSKNEIILCSDSGNILDKNWIKNIVKPFTDKKTDVVAGYYKGRAKTVFQQCVIPYALVMPDKVNPNDFLPATRSVAFTKSIWEKVGGFDESLSHNEDYIFARALKEKGANIVFNKDAVVYWMPRNNIKQTFIMLWRFAFGDSEAGIFRTNVLLLFARYFFGIYFILLCGLYRSVPGFITLFVLLVLYVIWSIHKNYKYVNNKKAFIILPFLQFTADAAVLSGTISGLLKRIKLIGFFTTLKNNKLLTATLLVYCSTLLTTINWGAPNIHHPFPYHMDEWHQLQAVANTFRFGTPNTAGSANGTMLHFIYSGMYLIPFTLFKIIDPFSLELTNGLMRERVFEVLRLQTILFGVLSIVFLYKAATLINASKKLTIVLFTFTPIWLALSGYFKYDIALLFWIILSVYTLLRFAKNPTGRNFLIASIPAAFAIAVKISAVPLFLMYVLAYFLFSQSRKKQSRYLVLGIISFIFCVVFFGMPDTIFGKGNILDYLYQNIINSPQSFSETFSGNKGYLYLVVHNAPIIFGHSLIFLFIMSSIAGFIFLIKDGFNNINKHKITFFLIISLSIFTLSLLPLRITAAGNRTLVLLPFLVLLIGLAFSRFYKISPVKTPLTILLVIASIAQLFVTFSFIHMKFVPSPQVQASDWISTNIPKDTTIGVENIPVYQQLPDIVQKEFYLLDYKKEIDTRYTYQIVSSKSDKLPPTVVITNEELEPKVIKNSDKTNLVKELKKAGYKKLKVFTPDHTYFVLFGNDVDYYFSGLMASPWTTSIYAKNEL